MKAVDVTILGGGLGGLNAARLLHRAGVPFHLFEARDRLGGRILSAGETSTPDADGFDLGPSWFWPRRQPGFADLVREMGLQTFAQHTTGSILFKRSPREAPQRVECIGQDDRHCQRPPGSAHRQADASGLPEAVNPKA